MEVRRNKNAKELAGQTLTALFKEASDEQILFLSSGGSALEILEGIDKQIFGSNFTIGILDDRFSPDPVINNFLQLKNKLGDAINVNWIDSVPLGDDTPEILASRIEDFWSKWRRNNPKNKIIATMGMGVDGHTAGIFHMEPRTFHIEPRRLHRWVVGYAGVSSRFPLRVTATFEFLRNEVDFAIVYIFGEEKRPALENVLADSGSLEETPARIFREMKNVKIFTDIS